MKIAISSQGTGLSAQVDPRFGRCQYFIVIDPETMQFESLENSNIMAGGGAGISTAQVMVDKEVQVVLTGNCGPNAYETLSAAGIRVITGVSGTIQEAVNGYNADRFQPTSQPNVDSHFGMGMGGGMGSDINMGRGMGGGKGMGAGVRSANSSPSFMGPEQGIAELKTQVQMLGQQLDEMQRHIEELEKKGR